MSNLIFINKEKDIVVRLKKSDIQYCNKIAKIRSKYKKNKWDKNSYKNGILNTMKDYYKTERFGMYGEQAFSILANNLLYEWAIWKEINVSCTINTKKGSLNKKELLIIKPDYKYLIYG